MGVGVIGLDGGSSSTINLHVADDCNTGAVLAAAAFGGTAVGPFADTESLAAFGSNPPDPRCRIASAQAGRAPGRPVAAPVAAFLGVA